MLCYSQVMLINSVIAEMAAEKESKMKMVQIINGVPPVRAISLHHHHHHRRRRHHSRHHHHGHHHHQWLYWLTYFFQFECLAFG